MVFERTDALVYHPFKFQSVFISVFMLYAIQSLTSFVLYLLLIFNFLNCSMIALGSGLVVSIFGNFPYSSLIAHSFISLIKSQCEISV